MCKNDEFLRNDIILGPSKKTKISLTVPLIFRKFFCGDKHSKVSKSGFFSFFFFLTFSGAKLARFIFLVLLGFFIVLC